MFKLFRRKPSTPPVPVPTPAPGRPAACAAAAITEWNQSIADIREQFESVLVAAIYECEPLVADTTTQLSPIEKVWQPVEGDLQKAQTALTRAWARVRGRIYKDASVNEAVFVSEENRLDEQSLELELAYKAAHRQVRAKAAQVMMEFALHQDARTRFCGDCGAAMDTLLIGQTQDVACPGCAATCRVEPGHAFRVFAAVAARWVGEWDGYPYFQVMKRAELRIERYRNSADVPMDLLHEFHDAALAYWDTTLGVEAHLVPHLAKHVPAAVAGHMKGVFRLLRHHWQWRTYEG